MYDIGPGGSLIRRPFTGDADRLRTPSDRARQPLCLKCASIRPNVLIFERDTPGVPSINFGSSDGLTQDMIVGIRGPRPRPPSQLGIALLRRPEKADGKDALHADGWGNRRGLSGLEACGIVDHATEELLCYPSLDRRK